MRYDYFHYTDLDRRFYEEHLKTRMPARFLDAHTHINLPEHIVDVPPERIADDWALQNGLHMTAEDAAFYYHTLFPDRQWAITAFPFPVKMFTLGAGLDLLSHMFLFGTPIVFARRYLAGSPAG